MKKARIIIALIISAAMFTACSDKNNDPEIGSSDDPNSISSSGITVSDGSETAETKEQTSESPADTSDSTDTAEPELYGVSAVGLDGINVPEEELTDVYAENTDERPDVYQLISAVGEGFTYLAEPTGICLNSRDNADIFNEDELTFEGIPQNAPSEYKRYNIGDTICGLTLTDANTAFYYGGVDSCRAELEGSVTMTGYIAIAPEDEYGIDEGDIFFVPCPGNDLLPVVNFRYEGVGLINPLYVAMSEGFAHVNEYSGSISLGNVHRTDLDLSGIPADYSFSAKARVTVDKVNLSCSGFSCDTVCNLTDIVLL